ncbi:MAG: hypothetical protein J6Y25_01010 [Elusimicrobiaceae bacterium]|nr:hypothetical protein [Elusimicrobiaceae bacterium]MBP5616711.1 hypothetical protein [Elusimicrobiaceae bacterium]
MKVRVLWILFVGVLVAGCSSLQDPSKRHVNVPTDFLHPNANSAYYEFSSSKLDAPSVLEEQPVEETVVAVAPGADEDFTAENISSAYGTYGDVVVTVATHKFKLGANAARKEMTAFQRALDSAHSTVMGQFHPVGFTYAMSSVGAVNPLSDVEVACKLSERSANQMGQTTCNSFFKTITSRYLQFIREDK